MNLGLLFGKVYNYPLSYAMIHPVFIGTGLSYGTLPETDSSPFFKSLWVAIIDSSYIQDKKLM